MMIDEYHSQIEDKHLKDAITYVILLIVLDGKKEMYFHLRNAKKSSEIYLYTTNACKDVNRQI